MSNKWTLEIHAHYNLDGEPQQLSHTHLTTIPPTEGNRIDMFGDSGKYHYDIDKKKLPEKSGLFIVIENGAPLIKTAIK